MTGPVLTTALAHAGHPAATAPIGYVAPGLAMVALLFASVWFWTWADRRRRLDDDDPDDDGQGGGGQRLNPPPPTRPPDSDPAWWPEFEREFAAHVRARLAEEHLPARAIEPARGI